MRRNDQNQGGRSMSKKIYISGKMGEKVLSNETKRKFEKAQNRLVKKGWAVINPASDVFQKDAIKHVRIEEKKGWEEISEKPFNWYAWTLLWDMHCLCVCDAIYMLSDWKESPGATTEYYFAKASGLEIIFEE